MEEPFDHYDLVFSGETVPGISVDIVKKRLAGALKTSVNSVERLFSGNSVRLKKNIPQDAATKLQQQLRDLGVVVKLEVVEKALPISLEEVEPVQPNTAPKLGNTRESSLQVAPEATGRSAGAQGTNVIYSDGGVSLWEQLSVSVLLYVLLLITGVVFITVFFPWPDGVWRRGFFIGLIFSFFAYRQIKSSIVWG